MSGHGGLDDALGTAQPAPNPSTVLPVVLLVDTSNSMNIRTNGGQSRMVHLLAALQRIRTELSRVGEARRGAEISLVTFGGDTVAHADLRADGDRRGHVPTFVPLTEVSMPTTLTAAGHTPLEQVLDVAVRLVRDRNAQLHKRSRYRANVWLITDGQNTGVDGMPTPVSEQAIARIRDLESEHLGLFFTAMLPGADETAIRRITPQSAYPIEDFDMERIVKLIVVSSESTADEAAPAAIFKRLNDVWSA
jgi:uncharacterized protein YegL